MMQVGRRSRRAPTTGGMCQQHHCQEEQHHCHAARSASRILALSHQGRPAGGAGRGAPRAFLSLGESLHSCFLERSRQQEATHSFAYCSLCMLLRRCACWLRPLGFPLQNIDAQRQQGRQPWGQPTEGLCTTRRAGSACRAHPLGRSHPSTSDSLCLAALLPVMCQQRPVRPKKASASSVPLSWRRRRRSAKSEVTPGVPWRPSTIDDPSCLKL